MTLKELSEVLWQNSTPSNEPLEVRKLILEDGVLEVIFWDAEEDFIYSELDFLLPNEGDRSFQE
jgi:hypothetical protein